ncbi:MAG: hypothetical protein R3F61_03705 [Myxococcota bacterium]
MGPGPCPTPAASLNDVDGAEVRVGGDERVGEDGVRAGGDEEVDEDGVRVGPRTERW